MQSDFIRWLLNLKAIPKDASGVHLTFERGLDPWVWALLLAAAAGLAGWSYWRLAGPRTARWLLAVARFLLIALVLVLIAGPALEQPREIVEQDWVLVLADRSASMTIADLDEPGVLGAGSLGPRRMTRDTQLRHALSDHSEAWRHLAQQHHVVWLGFHGGVFDLGATPDQTPPSGAAATVPDPGEAVGRQTSLGTSLEQALQRASARPISGVVILSDGRTDDPPSRSIVRRLLADAVPVYVVPLGSAHPLGDVAIARVDAPRRAFVRDQVPVTIELDRSGAAAAELHGTVRLIDEATGEELDQQPLPTGSETGDGESAETQSGPQRITLLAKPALAGRAQWKVVVETDRPDLIPANNVHEVSLELVDRPLRVLYVDGYPRWEYRYLKNLLVREKTIDSSVMLLSADRDFAQEGNQPITRLPRSPGEFAEFDVMIVGDVPGGFFSPQQLEAMRDQVAERGAGLLWIGGEHSLPSSYGATVLADLLPIRGSLALTAIGGPVNLKPTPLAERLGVLRLSLGERAGWPVELLDPAIPWSLLYYAQRIEPSHLKPTAEVLGQTVQEFNGSPLPLVVRMRYGAGQTVYVATDEIWRWRYGRGEQLPEQFWVQLIRMLGRESLSGAGEPATLLAEPSRVPAGQPVRITLHLHDAQLMSQERITVPVVLQGEDGRTVAEAVLRRVPGAGGENQFAATYLPDVVGSLRVRVDDPALKGLDLQATVDVYRGDEELRRPEADHELLASLAAETGGAVLAAGGDDLDTLPATLRNRSVRILNPLTEPIWNTPLAFTLLLLLLTLEWVGRRMIRLT